MGEPEKKKKEDPRPKFFYNYLSKSMSVKQEQWMKLIGGDEGKEMIMDFLDNPERVRITFTLSGGGTLAASLDFPAKTKTKTVYFIRHVIPTKLTLENMSKALMYGDILPNILENLEALLPHIIIPICNNPKSNQGWTSVLINDIKTESQNLLNHVVQMKGHMINRTILPLPVCIEELMQLAPTIAAGDISVVTIFIKHSMEDIVVKWRDAVTDLISVNTTQNVLSMAKNPIFEHLQKFWNARLENLEHLAGQLGSARIKTVAYVLDKIGSVFAETFHHMVSGIMASLAEARDITLYLPTLTSLVDRFESLEMEEAHESVCPLLITIGLVWGHSKYFHTVENMILLFNLIHNSLINCAMRYIEPDNIFNGDVGEAFQKINVAMVEMDYYKENYTVYRNGLVRFKEGTEFFSQDWTWQTAAIFTRFDAFVERLEQLKEIFAIGMDFDKVEKLTVGGICGRNITAAVQAILEEYNVNYIEWSKIEYNALDPDLDAGNFPRDRRVFLEKTELLEGRLAFQIRKALETSRDAMTCGTLLLRPIIYKEIESYVQILISEFADEIYAAKIIFNNFNTIYLEKGMGGLPTDLCFPKASGTICWLVKFHRRISLSYNRFVLYELAMFDSEEGEQIVKNFKELIGEVQALVDSIMNKWIEDVKPIIESGIEKTLLKKTDTYHITINFANKIKQVFDDVRNLRNMQWVGDNYIMDFFERQPEIWDATIKLIRIVEWYNDTYQRSQPCETELLLDYLQIVSKKLEPLLKKMTWKDFDQNYVINVFSFMKILFKRIETTQDNLSRIQKSIKSWGDIPLYRRKDNDPQALIECSDRKAIWNERLEAARETIRLIDELMLMNAKLFLEEDSVVAEMQKFQSKANLSSVQSLAAETSVIQDLEELSEEGEEEDYAESDIVTRWDRYAYLEEFSQEKQEMFSDYELYADTLIAKSLTEAVGVSVCYLRDEIMSQHKGNAPSFEIIMDLKYSNIQLLPSLDKMSDKGFMTFMQNLFNDIFRMFSILPRISQSKSDTSSIHDFIDEFNESLQSVQHRSDTMFKVKSTIRDVRSYLKTFDSYAHIWKENKEECLNEVKVYGRTLTADERIAGTEKQLYDPENPPLTVYQSTIEYYVKISEEVARWKTEKIFQIWLRLNMKSFKRGVLNEIARWISYFKKDLILRVINSLKELSEFIKESNEILSVELDKEDYAKLVKILSVISAINERQVKYDKMFGPLRDVIELLKLYDYNFSEFIISELNELPGMFNQLKALALRTRQAVAPIQTYQVDLLEKRISLFDVMTSLFRKRFTENEIFKPGSKNPYPLIDMFHFEIIELEKQLVSLQESAILFELNGPNATRIERSRKDINLIKIVWDYVSTIATTINDWKRTLWKKIDIELLEQECKKFGKDLRALGADVRIYEPYIDTEKTLKNLMTSLRTITELQNPAMRPRHWEELMRKTKVRFSLDDKTTLANLLDLNLHNFEEEVKDIVDKASKEMQMEKSLGDIKLAWSTAVFENEIHERTGLKLLKIAEETIEMLEEHQVALQSMLSSKFIAYFFSQVSSWQHKLSNADQVTTSWFEVQRKWMYLESIFIGSEDIRRQLPNDSKRFDNIDKEFRNLLAIINHNLNVVTATNAKAKILIDGLERLLRELLMCEKALNDYLETKRLAYPRFYFVSSADLLDILSNGNNPPMVCRHLTKLYDSLGKLVMIEGSKVAKEMVAKELEEHVPFLNNCDCSGLVEQWLNRVTDSMRETLRNTLFRAISEYDKKLRHVWIFDWPAQLALVGTQIWWTAETNDAFFKVSMRYENALKDYNRKQVNQLNSLILLLLGDLTPGERQKIMTVCTIDVHSRDVISKIIAQRVEVVTAFQWQSQLRLRWDNRLNDCFANICDAQFTYDYEYLGNTPRLVITPLTDRCYITLTQSLHLIMGGAPAGPAGTGKTETTKDLGRALGMMVYVFNCSEQMDYRSCGNIHKGLAQTGAWGCFDEFNRISVEVLSVVAVQVKCILDAIKTKKVVFNFLGEIINLRPTCGMFITMNPGYAGRAELPENLKALYRPCAMVVPDFALICEIMLVAEGFQEARLLARKFITLYTLCRELLSKQDHYDWGLRAIKSVLVVAGALRRGDRLRPEDQVLMRALRDFNIPKIVTDDTPVFMGLIGDLFPALDVPRKRNLENEADIQKAAVDLELQPEEGFILKIVQLEELLAVRHSVFILGVTGSGKSEVWKTLHRTYQNQKRKPMFNDLNPKAVTCDELFGIVNPATRDWKDGLISIILRDQANLTGSGPRWIVLDGDIDPMWIESLNTVMDDNKVLTLASNERIALTKEMRLLFEIANLRTATPATVSRAGILNINITDVGWSPIVASWLNTRKNLNERATLHFFFEKYVPPLLDIFKTRMKKITPICDIALIQMTCFLLEHMLTPQNVPNQCPRDWYEIYFVFCVIWGFGSALFQDQIVDWRNEFHKWWINEFKSVNFPADGTIFSYYVDHETKKFLPWTNLVPSFELDMDVPLQSNLVPTSETTRLRYFMDILIHDNHPVMLIGPPGSGKSIMMAAKLNSLDDSYAVTNVPFNFYTTSEMLQEVLEKPLEKKAGRNFGPPGNKQMIYFVDDMNMPEVDLYFTVQPHTLIRQFMDYHHWYDRIKMSLKDIHNCQFVSCMNPAAGSFTINPRLQRHFCSFAVNAPSSEALYQILYSILSQHLALETNKFTDPTKAVCKQLVSAAIILHQRISSAFLPTAIKFHYIFNLRDIGNIFTGLLYSNFETCPNPDEFLRLWVHESTRVYSDKLVEIDDLKLFKKLTTDIVRKNIENFTESIVFPTPSIYCHFAKGLAEIKYMPIPSWEHLSNLLEEAQSQYNELIGAMNLVLFEDAMCHICRISRIIESSRGYALLIGVGGSGKQSLTRLASFISGLDVFQIQLKKDYSVGDLKVDISNLFLKCGVKSAPCCFLMTDSEVAKEEYLVLVNDLLATGIIHELFVEDEIDKIIGAVRNEVKQAGIFDSSENCWKYFIEKVRSLLKVVLCFSPVGTTLRVRARKFPALVNCTTIDWFHKWPQEALESVSFRFLSDIDFLPTEIAGSISHFMAHVHESVDQISQVYLANDKRYNYTTPKTFLELISLYTKLLVENVTANMDRKMRLENGLIKLASCTEEVDGLQDVLKDQEVELKIKNDAADELIVVVGTENEKVATERAFASKEEKNVRIIEADVTEKAKVCEEDLRKAEPALLAAQEALNTLNKGNLTELKSFGSPPQAVVNVLSAVIVLFSKRGSIPKDRSWKAARGLMGNVDKFLFDLINYDKKHIHPDIIKALLPYLNDPEFDPELVQGKSLAAGGLCSWVVNIHRFYEVYLVVEPKERALLEAEKELNDARDKLTELNDRLEELEGQLQVLQARYDEALSQKQKCQDEADKTAFTIDLAHRLIGGLSTEKVRWIASVKSLNESQITLPGDILQISCFISYVGCFTRPYRMELQNNEWLPKFKTMEPPIPTSDDSDPFDMICDDAQIAEWNNQGLPSDRMSTENAAILVHSERYPLMIDPQLQGIKWVRQKYAQNLIVLRLTQRGYLDAVEKAISNGNVLLLENIGENVDAVLNPLLGRMLIKKGTAIKIGDKEIDFNPKFRLILHTKLANPHYKPEMQAQTTLINFTVTRDGLEEQLLAEVVKAERADLELLRTKLTQQQNHFKITLKFLEDDLLKRLAAAGENVLEDVTLVMNLEKTKRTADEIEVKVAEAKITAAEIDAARENYRPAAVRSSIIYFILNDLFKINPIYQFSLKAFTVVFGNAIMRADTGENVKERVVNLIESITFCSYMYTARGLFESDKLIFLTQLAIQILVNSNEIDLSELDFLLRYPYNTNAFSKLPFLTDVAWGGIRALSSLVAFTNIDKDIEGSQKRWKKIVESELPEKEKLPGEWKGKTAFQKLCIMRCLRPDRMTYAMQVFIDEMLGPKYVDARSIEFAKTFEESSPETHMFFVLSPGVDPLADVEKLGKILGFSTEKENFHNVSLGQGQEIVAENSMQVASELGHWVILQNIHLVAKWLPSLEKKMEATLQNPHPDYRLFLSAEPAADPAYHILPQGILESAIKITSEPPTGMQANIHKALDNFNQDTLEMCSKETEFKAILFALCYFHAVVAERRKFGPQGWNRVYPFNNGDLTISVYVLYNYLEANTRVPWEDLRYLFGEIMYGGHITDDWDRRLCSTYLEEFMQGELIDGDLEYCPGFPAPGILRYEEYHAYIDDVLPPESPNLYGLHLNAEIIFLTNVAERLFRIVFELQPRTGGAAAASGEGDQSPDDVLRNVLEELIEKVPQPFNIYEMMSRCEDRNPYIIVAFQECERMNSLMNEIKRSLTELELGLKGELSISRLMEELSNSLFLDVVPASWTKLAYPSLLGLQAWFADLLARLRELEVWVSEFKMPPTVWLAGFFNPQSFLTAIMQQTARKNEWPLDRMCLNCDVTKKTKEAISLPPREGAFVSGLYMEGARWDSNLGSIADSKPKELFPLMPIIYIKAVTQDKQDIRSTYECPVYKIRMRGPTFVWTFNLKTKAKAAKWTLAGVCLLLQT